jgi:hypothetical protein
VFASGPLGLTAAGFGPAEDGGFLWVIKSVARLSFGGEVKPSVHVVDLQHVKEPYTA